MSAFWNKFKKEEEKKKADKKPVVGDEKKEEKEDKKPAEEKAKKSSKGKKSKIENYKEKAQLINRVIIKPIISEDAMNKEAQAKYVFEVDKNSSKKQIAQAVGAKYKVDVVKVNVISYKPKSRRFRYNVGKTRGFKKAIVTVKSGQKIELFSE